MPTDGAAIVQVVVDGPAAVVEVLTPPVPGVVQAVEVGPQGPAGPVGPAPAFVVSATEPENPTLNMLWIQIGG